MPNQSDQDRLWLLADIAEWYYVDGLSQQEIAKRVDMSRPSISRLLDDARDLEIVEFSINRPIPTDQMLEGELVNRFGLQKAYVLKTVQRQSIEMLKHIGRLGAMAFRSSIRDGMIIGLSWGTTVHAVVQSLRPDRLPKAKVVQLLGGVGAPYSSIDGPEQVRRVGGLLSAQHYYLNAPMLVGDPIIAAGLRQDYSINQVLTLAKQTETALVGIGSVIPEISTQYHSGYVTHENLMDLQTQGVVGAMCTSFFDIQGNHVPAPWCDDCSISVTWEDLTQIPNIIGVSGGNIRKAPAILGALRTGTLNILVTDDLTADSILKLDQGEQIE